MTARSDSSQARVHPYNKPAPPGGIDGVSRRRMPCRQLSKHFCNAQFVLYLHKPLDEAIVSQHSLCSVPVCFLTQYCAYAL
eukprot:1158515-Pelagomonas_calceolata.AAC.5